MDGNAGTSVRARGFSGVPSAMITALIFLPIIDVYNRWLYRCFNVYLLGLRVSACIVIIVIDSTWGVSSSWDKACTGPLNGSFEATYIYIYTWIYNYCDATNALDTCLFASPF